MDEKLQMLIKRAEMAGACSDGIEIVRSLGTIEKVLACSRAPRWACWYAKNVYYRDPDFEEIIMKQPRLAFYHARYFIKNRWPEAEPFIASDPYWASRYEEVFKVCLPGEKATEPCLMCEGSGKIVLAFKWWHTHKPPRRMEATCLTCKGSGKVIPYPKGMVEFYICRRCGYEYAIKDEISCFHECIRCRVRYGV